MGRNRDRIQVMHLAINGYFWNRPNTGSGPLVRFLEWLYRVTGQRGGHEDDGALLEQSPLWLRAKGRLESAGFVARLERVRLENSEALVIVAEKEAGGE